MGNAAFVREPRYVVLKIKDLDSAGVTPDELAAFNAVCDKVTAHRLRENKPPLACVVVEADWRCYEAVWSAVEAEHNANVARAKCAEAGHKMVLSPVVGAGSTCLRCGAWEDEDGNT